MTKHRVSRPTASGRRIKKADDTTTTTHRAAVVASRKDVSHSAGAMLSEQTVNAETETNTAAALAEQTQETRPADQTGLRAEFPVGGDAVGEGDELLESADASVPPGPASEYDDEPEPPVDVFAGKPVHALRSWVDSISDRGIDGWAMIPTRPLHRCFVGLKDGDEVVARTIASRFRPDLLSAGIGDGCHAFLLPMPRSLLDGDEHLLQIVELDTGAPLTRHPIQWRSTAGTAETVLKSVEAQTDVVQIYRDSPTPVAARGNDGHYRQPTAQTSSAMAGARATGRHIARVTTRVLFDVSDLVYYIGHHPNLTGIQRVQSSILLAIVANGIISQDALVLLSFNARSRRWSSIPVGFFVSLLKDLLQPELERMVPFPALDAREGILPGAQDYDGVGMLDDGIPSVFCLLGAAWVQRDYFHRVTNLKRQFGTRLVVTIHDLIPIYARETCDQGTALVFEQFLRRALRHTDYFLCVSEHTAKDLKRYAASLSLPVPPITVTKNGSSFEEFLPQRDVADAMAWDRLPERYVLFVATIEGRKNHRLIFDIWRRMAMDGDDTPHLICVGRVGWKSEAFITGLVETNYLDGKVILLKEVSDAQLKILYERCLFTLCPSLYEGWGLPVGESLAAGKVCVCSDRASIPEVAGKFGVYVDISDADKSRSTIRGLIADPAALAKMEAKIRREYQPGTWRSVAQRVVAACLEASKLEIRTPYVTIPYSTEISFAAAPGRDADGIFGEDLLARIVEARKGLFLYEPLQEENFLRGEEARSGNNWAEPENWGTWLCHSGGELALELAPNEALVYYVGVRLRASGPLSDLRVRLYGNGEFLWGDSIGARPRDIMLRVRKKADGSAGWRLRLRAEATLTPELSDRIAAVDGRIPTIGFERLLVVPDNDVKTRMDMLSMLLT